MKTEPLIEYLQKVHLQKMNSKEIQVGGGGGGYEAKLNFHRGGVRYELRKSLCGGGTCIGMDIFWNGTMVHTLSKLPQEKSCILLTS